MRFVITVPDELCESLLLWSQADCRYPKQQVEWIIVQALRQWVAATNVSRPAPADVMAWGHAQRAHHDERIGRNEG